MSFFIEEIKSGRCTIYAQWCALLSLISLIGTPFLVFFSPSLWIFCICSWVLGLIVLLLEFPVFSFFYRIGSTADRMVTFTRRPLFRGPSYLAFATVMWVSTLFRTSILLASAILLTCTAVLYGISAIKQEEPVESKMKGGTGITTA